MMGELWQKSVEIKRDKVYMVDDYKSLPGALLNQLINEELVGLLSPTSYHQKVLRNLFVKFRGYISGKNPGERCNALELKNIAIR